MRPSILHSRRGRAIAFLGVVAGILASGGASAAGDGRAHQPDEHAAQRPGWWDPPTHAHVSGSGAPLIHPFGVEPAFTHRDLFVEYGFRDGDGGSEHEIGLELEWAVTHGLGFVVEIPWRSLDLGEEGSADGFGDLAVSPRFLLVDSDRFLLAANVEVEVPTGDEGRGLGRGETAIAPSFSLWGDLGGWWTAHAQVGWEHGFDSGEDELFLRAAVIKTLGEAHEGHEHPGDVAGEASHLAPGHLSLIAEAEALVGLSGEERHVVTAEGLVGLSYGWSERVDLRAGFRFPLSSPREFDAGLVAGFIWHF